MIMIWKISSPWTSKLTKFSLTVKTDDVTQATEKNLRFRVNKNSSKSQYKRSFSSILAFSRRLCPSIPRY